MVPAREFAGCHAKQIDRESGNIVLICNAEGTSQDKCRL